MFDPNDRPSCVATRREKIDLEKATDWSNKEQLQNPYLACNRNCFAIVVDGEAADPTAAT